MLILKPLNRPALSNLNGHPWLQQVGALPATDNDMLKSTRGVTLPETPLAGARVFETTYGAAAQVEKRPNTTSTQQILNAVMQTTSSSTTAATFSRGEHTSSDSETKAPLATQQSPPPVASPSCPRISTSGASGAEENVNKAAGPRAATVYSDVDNVCYNSRVKVPTQEPLEKTYSDDAGDCARSSDAMSGMGDHGILARISSKRSTDVDASRKVLDYGETPSAEASTGKASAWKRESIITHEPVSMFSGSGAVVAEFSAPAPAIPTDEPSTSGDRLGYILSELGREENKSCVSAFITTIGQRSASNVRVAHPQQLQVQEGVGTSSASSNVLSSAKNSTSARSKNRTAS
ncbi:unnamed protein product, partial [Amoebophrya sp. A25]|eukprot:GSA25T00001140001.1